MEAKDLTEEELQIIKEVSKEKEKTVSIENFKKMKATLNAAFGPENNQILSPFTEESILQLLRPYRRQHMSSQTFKKFIGDMCKNLFTVHIRFPEVEVKNSSGLRHKITDMFICAIFNHKAQMVGNFTGLRASATIKEIVNTYQHSHISGFNVQQIPWCNFCTGTGPINQVVNQLRGGFSEMHFQLFCSHLKVFLAWESLEGTPYNYIQRVQSPSERRLQSTFPVQEIEQVADELLSKTLKLLTLQSLKQAFKLEIQEGKILVSPTDDLEQMYGAWFKEGKITANVITRQNQSILTPIFSYKDSKGNYCSTAEGASLSRQNITYKKTPILIFKKQPILFKITDEEDRIKQTLYANPVFTKRVCEKLAILLNKEAIKCQDVKLQCAIDSE